MKAISIIIPTFNQASLLGRALDSALAQSAPPLEVLVVDDGSTDGTRALVEGRSTPGLRYLRQANAGVSAARNHGIRAAAGDYLLFLDSDDSLLPGALATLLTAITPENPPDLVHADWSFVSDLSGRAIDRSSRFALDPLPTLIRRNPMAIHAVLVRREALGALGGFADRGGALEDWEVWLRLALEGGRFEHVAEPVARYHWRPGSGSSDIERMHATRMAVLAEVRRDPRAASLSDSDWQDANRGAWMDLFAGRWQAERAEPALAALAEALRVDLRLAYLPELYLRAMRADYLEALTDQEGADAPMRAKRAEVRGRATLEAVLRHNDVAAGRARAAEHWAQSLLLAGDGRQRAALVAWARAMLYSPRLLGDPDFLRLGLGRLRRALAGPSSRVQALCG
jgi:hypothetical protein